MKLISPTRVYAGITILTIGLLIPPLFARFGETVDQLQERYGKGGQTKGGTTTERKYADEVWSFKKEPFNILAYVSKGVCFKIEPLAKPPVAPVAEVRPIVDSLEIAAGLVRFCADFACLPGSSLNLGALPQGPALPEPFSWRQRPLAGFSKAC